MCGSDGRCDRPDLAILQSTCTACGWHFTDPGLACAAPVGRPGTNRDVEAEAWREFYAAAAPTPLRDYAVDAALINTRRELFAPAAPLPVRELEEREAARGLLLGAAIGLREAAGVARTLGADRTLVRELEQRALTAEKGARR